MEPVGEMLVAGLLDLARTAGLHVPAPCAARIVDFLLRMLALNEIHNLTAIRDPRKALVLHALDSLQAVPVLEALPAGALLDLGTGNGFPGVAAAAAFATRSVLFVERRRKKAAAVEEALRGAGFTNFEVRTCDAKDLLRLAPATAGCVAAGPARAFGDLSAALALARPWLAEGGIVVQWKEGNLEPTERADAARTARLLGMAGVPDREYTLPATGPDDRPRARRLVIHRTASAERTPAPPGHRFR